MSARDSWLGSLGLDSGRVEFPSSAALVELALAAGEGQLTDTGSLSVQTGRFTGRCPERRFIVSGGTAHADVDWGKVNKPIMIALQWEDCCLDRGQMWLQVQYSAEVLIDHWLRLAT